jgi:LDH2 family malate/lactate/ureidoglycolate dehydrogenase
VPTFDAEELEAFARRTLEAIGLPADHADVTARCLVAANLRGLDSHGVLRLEQYADSVAAGDVRADADVRVVEQAGCRALVDAGGGYGYAPMTVACDLARSLAGAHGVAVVAVRDSHHFGVAGIYAQSLADAGLVGVVLTNAQPVMAPPGVSVALVGNNPLAIGAPREPPSPPIVLDMALSQTALGRIRLAAAEGRPIPEGWALDEHGRPTTDATRALAANLLAPAGGHKGLGLAIMIDVLAGILTGSPFGGEADAHGRIDGGVGHLVIALAPDLFVARERFLAGVEELVRHLKAHDTPEAPVLLPGEPELAAEERRRRDGIELSPELAARLDRLAERLGVAGLD